jgi:hypothetical protein
MAFDLKSVLVGPVSTLIVSIKQTINTAIHIFDVMQEIVDNVVDTYNEIKNFDINPNWKVRALSAPEAIDNVKDLIKVPTKLFIAVKDLVSRVKNSVNTFSNPAAEAEAAMAEAGGLESGLLRLLPRLANLIGKALARLLALAGLIVQVVLDVDNAIADIATISRELKTTVQSLNKLDVVFLKQSNSRRTVKLLDGGSMRIRVGKLHS